jgi:hypothetical protein
MRGRTALVFVTVAAVLGGPAGPGAGADPGGWEVATTGFGSFAVWPDLTTASSAHSWAIDVSFYGTVAGTAVGTNPSDIVGIAYTGSIGSGGLAGTTTGVENIVDGWGDLTPAGFAISGTGVVTAQVNGSGAPYTTVGSGTIQGTVRYAQYSHHGYFCVGVYVPTLSVDPDGPGPQPPVGLSPGPGAFDEFRFYRCGPWVPTSQPVNTGSFLLAYEP